MKLRTKKGFTLMEMLIVVAIIAILVAVSIPIFTSQLEKSREQTDIANMRSAKSLAVATYLAGGVVGDDDDASNGFGAADDLFYYDAVNGVLDSDAPAEAYGKGTSADGGVDTAGFTYTASGDTGDYTESVVTVYVESTGTVHIGWEDIGD